MTFGERLKKTMQEIGITQSQLVGMTGIGKSSISQYLSGKNVPTKERRRERLRRISWTDFLMPALVRLKSMQMPWGDRLARSRMTCRRERLPLPSLLIPSAGHWTRGFPLVPQKMLGQHGQPLLPMSVQRLQGAGQMRYRVWMPPWLPMGCQALWRWWQCLGRRWKAF